MDTNDLTQKAQDVRDNLEEQTQDWRQRATEWKQRATEWKDRATTAMRDASQTADEYVHENAWTSIALAAVIGCVVGFLLSRRDSD